MNGPPTREEVDAKLDNVRMSAEVFYARMDARCAEADARQAKAEVRFAQFQAEMSAFKAEIIAVLDERLAEMRAEFNAKFAALYKAMIITAITSALTIILGVGAINATVYTGLLSAFGKGEELGQMYTRLGQRMLEQDAQFNRMILKQREDFARLEATLDARFAEEKAERARQQNRRAARR
jgi:hypothetical protein